MRLFLIRHGETVDNIAQLYAGSKDSELTNHGYRQATLLGAHLQGLGIGFTHIFSSTLQRAYKTAGLIREAQLANQSVPVPDVVKLPALVERDFGSYEGIRWDNQALREKIKKDPAFVRSESKDLVARRMDSFLDDHILPLLTSQAPQDHVVAVVSHGIALSMLWTCLLARFPPNSISLSSDLLEHSHLPLDCPHWSNTGYLELHMHIVVPSPPSAAITENLEKNSPDDDSTNLTDKISNENMQAISDTNKPDTASPSPPNLLVGWSATVVTINGRRHLKGHKRARGGIGSARHDPSQKSMDNFVKRRKIE